MEGLHIHTQNSSYLLFVLKSLNPARMQAARIQLELVRCHFNLHTPPPTKQEASGPLLK